MSILERTKEKPSSYLLTCPVLQFLEYSGYSFYSQLYFLFLYLFLHKILKAKALISTVWFKDEEERDVNQRETQLVLLKGEKKRRRNKYCIIVLYI